VTAGALLVAIFVLIERRVSRPLLPLGLILDRDRGASFLSIGISGIGSFAVFLFVTYCLENTLRYSPIKTGLAFLPFVALLVAGAVVSGGVLLRTGPRPLVPIGGLLAATAGMALLTGIGTASGYASSILPALLVMDFGSGMIFASAQNAATSGVRSDCRRRLRSRGAAQRPPDAPAGVVSLAPVRQRHRAANPADRRDHPDQRMTSAHGTDPPR
jgi:hypothetical protein